MRRAVLKLRVSMQIESHGTGEAAAEAEPTAAEAAGGRPPLPPLPGVAAVTEPPEPSNAESPAAAAPPDVVPPPPAVEDEVDAPVWGMNRSVMMESIKGASKQPV